MLPPFKGGVRSELCNYGGASLHCNLLSGPDFTNQLIGILMRFRSEEVAFMGDIETMFYQVKVPDSQGRFG